MVNYRRMNPDQPPKLPPLSPDYLDQIAPQPRKRFNLSKKQLLIVAIAGGALLLAIILIIAGSFMSNSKPTEVLAARLQTTSEIVNDASTKIKSTSLRALNSNLKIYLTNTLRDIKAPLASSHVDIDKLNSDVLTAESGDTMLATLEDARLNAKYDRIYASEMSYQLDTIVNLMQQIYNGTNNKQLKSFLQNAYQNLEPTQQQFAKFDETNY